MYGQEVTPATMALHSKVYGDLFVSKGTKKKKRRRRKKRQKKTEEEEKKVEGGCC